MVSPVSGTEKTIPAVMGDCRGRVAGALALRPSVSLHRAMAPLALDPMTRGVGRAEWRCGAGQAARDLVRGADGEQVSGSAHSGCWLERALAWRVRRGRGKNRTATGTRAWSRRPAGPKAAELVAPAMSWLCQSSPVKACAVTVFRRRGRLGRTAARVDQR